MDKFAFIAHPYDVEVLADRVIPEPFLKTKNRRLVERSLRWFSPFKRDTVIIRSLTGKMVEGDIIIVPLISEQILNMDEKFILKKIIEGGRLAQKLGAKIIGLGAYLAGIGKKGALLSQILKMPVTTGTSYTIAVAIEAALKAAKNVGIELNKAKVTIIGATGVIGKICSMILSSQVGSLILVARNQERLKNLADDIHLKYKQRNVVFSIDTKSAVSNSDIIIISTNTPSILFSINDLPRGCVVCDISVPHNVSSIDAEQSDILVVDGGLVRCPGEVNFHYLALPLRLSYACLAEVMILALEGIYENYSIGGDISLIKVLKINQLALKHGFKLADFTSFGKPVSENQIERVKRARSKRETYSDISTSN